MSISISMPSMASQSSSSNIGGGGGGSAIEALQKKIISLQKDLQEAIKTPTKEGQAKAKLIQLEIAATQTQLEQLIQQKAKALADKQAHNKSKANHTSSQNKNVLSPINTSFNNEFA